MGPFLASREWDGVHQYGYVFAGDGTVMVDSYGFICMHHSCESHYILKQRD